MSDTKHTQGPWGVDDSHGKRYIEPIGSNEPVAQVFKQQGNKDAYAANAKLIAAAPELLEALKATRNDLAAIAHLAPGDYVQKSIASADAAIAKAIA